ncbi:hypothetical protein FHS27_004271 [Rhodopirellula rubra]|uniref:Uncharacterized protein n=1 Tax=Aporhodopirellula rubra TaxID=980271 RepID=A0A7W5E342_9BACT|nr:hypothetical protein [Aporhodopirellula rubra]
MILVDIDGAEQTSGELVGVDRYAFSEITDFRND